MKWLNSKVIFLILGVSLSLSVLLYGFFEWGSSNTLKEASTVEEELRKDIERALESGVAVRYSIEENENRFSCLRRGGSHCSGKGGAFYLYSEDRLLLSQIAPRKGLSISKEACSDFPNKYCLFRIESEWKNIAHNNRCESKHPIGISVRLLINTGSGFREWKMEKTVYPTIDLSQRALCECEGKKYAYGSCEEKFDIRKRDFASLGKASLKINRDLYSVTSPEDAIGCSDTLTYDGKSYDISNRENEYRMILELNSLQCEGGIDYHTFICNIDSQKKQGVWKLLRSQSDCNNEEAEDCYGENCFETNGGMEYQNGVGEVNDEDYNNEYSDEEEVRENF